jgi:hypothetical protein
MRSGCLNARRKGPGTALSGAVPPCDRFASVRLRCFVCGIMVLFPVADRLPPACRTRDAAVSHPADTIAVGLPPSGSRPRCCAAIPWCLAAFDRVVSGGRPAPSCLARVLQVPRGRGGQELGREYPRWVAQSPRLEFERGGSRLSAACAAADSCTSGRQAAPASPHGPGQLRAFARRHPHDRPCPRPGSEPEASQAARLRRQGHDRRAWLNAIHVPRRWS